jgi:3-hydroxybutyrate dehydrogenase
MRDNKWGRIINTASAHGKVASADKAAYVASKFGLIGLTKAVALETANDGITCNAICPGWVHTEMMEAQITKKISESGKDREVVVGESFLAKHA